MLEVAGGILIAVGILLAAVILLPIVFTLFGSVIGSAVNGVATLLAFLLIAALIFAPLAIVGIAIEYLFPEHGVNGAIALFAIGAVAFMAWETSRYWRWKVQNRYMFSKWR